MDYAVQCETTSNGSRFTYVNVSHTTTTETYAEQVKTLPYGNDFTFAEQVKNGTNGADFTFTKYRNLKRKPPKPETKPETGAETNTATRIEPTLG
jgi:hypothetical protein